MSGKRNTFTLPDMRGVGTSLVPTQLFGSLTIKYYVLTIYSLLFLLSFLFLSTLFSKHLHTVPPERGEEPDLHEGKDPNFWNPIPSTKLPGHPPGWGKMFFTIALFHPSDP